MSSTIQRKVPSKWTDVACCVLVPKRIDGVIAVGRSASCILDTVRRTCESAIYAGQVGDTSAAMCARSSVRSRDLNAKELSKRPLADGLYLGDERQL